MARFKYPVFIAPYRQLAKTSEEYYLNNLLNEFNIIKANISKEPSPSLQSYTQKTIIKHFTKPTPKVPVIAPQSRKQPTRVITKPIFKPPLTSTITATTTDISLTEASDVPPNLDVYQSIPDCITNINHWFDQLDIHQYSPFLRTAGNLAAFLPHSETLSQLVKLGVDLSQIELVPGVANFLVKADFQKCIEPMIWKLTDLGFSLKQVAYVFTKFPKLMKLSPEDVESRLAVYTKLNFCKSSIVHIVSSYPNVLELNAENVELHLSQIQKIFHLQESSLKEIVHHIPKVILHPLWKIKDISVILTKALGFSVWTVKSMIVSKPELLITERDRLITNFTFMHTKLNLPLDQIATWSAVLTTAPHLLSQRATFLLRRGQFQPDPKRPLYTPLNAVVNGTDAEFCKHFALTDEQTYNVFLKTL